METLQRTANRGSVPTGYDIDNSLKLEADNAETIATTNQAAGNQKTWTWSCWLKRTELGSLQTIFGAGETYIRFDTPDIIQTSLGGNFVSTNQVFRDTSAWYHLVWILDTTQSTAADRSRIYINGSQITSFSAASYPAQNADLTVGGTGSSTNFLRLAQYWAGGRNYAGYMAEVHYLNGTVAEPTEFGEYDSDSGIWIPKQYTGGGYGTQGFYYKFDNASNLGEDSSGEGHDANSLGNITSADQATDTPTNNFSTLNPLHYTTRYTITEGATNQVSSVDGWGSSVGSIGVTSGKWYFEVQSADTNGYTLLGVIDQDSVIGTYVNGDAHAGDAPYGIAYYGGNGSIITNGSTVSGVSFPTWTTETMGCALDLDNNKIYFSKSGTYGNSGDPAAGSNGVSLPTGGSGTWFISTSTYFAASPAKTNQGGFTTNTPSSAASDANGYGTFEYAPPSGYYALCGKNLAEFGGTA